VHPAVLVAVKIVPLEFEVLESAVLPGRGLSIGPGGVDRDSRVYPGLDQRQVPDVQLVGIPGPVEGDVQSGAVVDEPEFSRSGCVESLDCVGGGQQIEGIEAGDFSCS